MRVREFINFLLSSHYNMDGTHNSISLLEGIETALLKPTPTRNSRTRTFNVNFECLCDVHHAVTKMIKADDSLLNKSLKLKSYKNPPLTYQSRILKWASRPPKKCLHSLAEQYVSLANNSYAPASRAWCVREERKDEPLMEVEFHWTRVSRSRDKEIQPGELCRL